MATVTNPQNDRRTLTQAGNEVGGDNLTLTQNTTNSMTPIIKWECPRKYSRIEYAGGMHPTRFEPRTTESFSGTTGDDTTMTLSTDIVPIAGEPEIGEQPFPVARAKNVTSGNWLDITDVDYSSNSITVGTDPANGDTVKVWPVLTTGTIQWRVLDQFGHELGSLDEWGTAMHVFSDTNQLKNDAKVHLRGRVQWTEAEELALYYDGPQTITWQDADYDEAFVSTIDQKVDVSV